MPTLRPPELPSTAERPAIQPTGTRRPFGVRLWLALMFAAIGILTGTSVYLFVSRSSEKAAEDTASQLAQGRALQLSGELGAKKGKFADTIIAQYRSAAFAPWVFNRYDELITDRDVEIADQTLAQVPNQRLARKKAANGRRFVSEFEAGLTVVALPIYRDDKVGPDGVVLVQAESSGRGLGRARRPARRAADRRWHWPCWSPGSSASSSPA